MVQPLLCAPRSFTLQAMLSSAEGATMLQQAAIMR
jgi:hypothetical protein